MANRDALLEIIPVLYELEAQERFYMSSWASGVVNINAHTITQCGTQFCMAGAKARYDGWLPVMKPRITPKGEVWIATGSFVPATHAGERFKISTMFAREAETIAREGFDLDEDEAHFLFYGTHISRVSDLERRIRWVAYGNHPDGFPGDWMDEEHEHAEQDDNLTSMLASRSDGPTEEY